MQMHPLARAWGLQATPPPTRTPEDPRRCAACSAQATLPTMVELGDVVRRRCDSPVLSAISCLSLLLLPVMSTGCYTGPDDLAQTNTDSDADDDDDDDDDNGVTGDDDDDDDDASDSESDGGTTGGTTDNVGSTDDTTGNTTDDPTNDPTNDTTDTTGNTTDDTTTGNTTDNSTTTGNTTDNSTTTGNTTDDSTTTTSTTGDPDVPDVPYCVPAANWPASYDAVEEEMLPIVNMHRAQGANCGSQGNFGAAPPLTMNPALRCAARIHSKDMAENNYFDHTNLQNEGPGDRIDKTGYNYFTWGENIAAGNATAAATVNQWMNSDGHCANIMNPNFEHIGIGYYPGGQWGHMWTQVFGAGG